MAKRSTQNQTCHNKAVKHSADMLRSYGWKVKADIPGYDRPSSVCVNNQCRRPDIVAKKDGMTKIIEWETPDSFHKDREQHTIFRQFARRQKNTHTSVRICDI